MRIDQASKKRSIVLDSDESQRDSESESSANIEERTQSKIREIPKRQKVKPKNSSESEAKNEQTSQNKTTRAASKKRKNSSIDDVEKYAVDTVSLMKKLYKEDLKALENKKPSTGKIDNIEMIYQRVINKDVQEACIKLGVLEEIKVWLEPLPDNSLPNQKIKKMLLDLLWHLKIAKIDLLQTGIGKIVNFYSKNSKEAKEVRILASNLVKKWKSIVLREDMEE